MTSLLAELRPETKRESIVRFALAVRRAWALRLYSRLFQLYTKVSSSCFFLPRQMMVVMLQAPMMSVYVMDLFVERERRAALRLLLKAYRPSLPVPFILTTLGFGEDDEAGLAFLTQLAILEDPTQDKIDTRKNFNV